MDVEQFYRNKRGRKRLQVKHRARSSGERAATSQNPDREGAAIRKRLRGRRYREEMDRRNHDNSRRFLRETAFSSERTFLVVHLSSHRDVPVLASVLTGRSLVQVVRPPGFPWLPVWWFGCPARAECSSRLLLWAQPP